MTSTVFSEFHGFLLSLRSRYNITSCAEQMTMTAIFRTICSKSNQRILLDTSRTVWHNGDGMRGSVVDPLPLPR